MSHVVESEASRRRRQNAIFAWGAHRISRNPQRAALGPGACGCRDRKARRAAARRLMTWVFVGCVTLSATSVAQASGWTVKPVPVPTLVNGQLSAVSCASPRGCMAIGSFIYSTYANASAPLVEWWDGTRWSIQHFSTPPGTAGSISGVSCRAGPACVVVGSFGDTSGWTVFAAHFIGTRWSIDRLPVPDQADGASVKAVSCSSGHDCTAVGYADYPVLGCENCDDFSRVLVERWNGRRWATQPVPAPAGGWNSSLSSVSCTSGTACVAVGSVSHHTADYGMPAGALVARWSGGRWSVQRPRGAPVALDSVACASTRRCTAVGGWRAVRWSGTRWSVQRTPEPIGAKGGGLSGVSCPSTTSCTAVGSFRNRAGRRIPVVVRWNGARWSIALSRNPTGATTGRLGAVACGSASSCVAVGSRTDGAGTVFPLTVSGTRSRWSPRTSPNPVGFGDTALASVSCPSPATCIAIGTLNFGPDELTEVWNGTTWTRHLTPNPTGAVEYTINALSCTNARQCVAVGDVENNGMRPLAERWNGSAWTMQHTPTPVGTAQSTLTGVSCASTTACSAVGYGVKGPANVGLPLAESWNGTTWTIQSTPNPPGTRSGRTLSGVSCTSSTACTAVGAVVGSAGPLAERWNGTSWTIQTTPDPGGGSFTNVSCPSATDCVAVGQFMDGLLAEHWDGTSWSAQQIPKPAATYATLSSVSCTAATACIAVGDDGAGGNWGDVPLVEQWDGSSWTIQPTPTLPTTNWDGTAWSIQSTPNPLITTDSTLSSVSCASVTFCTAVGQFTPGSNAEMALVEQGP